MKHLRMTPSWKTTPAVPKLLTGRPGAELGFATLAARHAVIESRFVFSSWKSSKSLIAAVGFLFNIHLEAFPRQFTKEIDRNTFEVNVIGSNFDQDAKSQLRIMLASKTVNELWFIGSNFNFVRGTIHQQWVHYDGPLTSQVTWTLAVDNSKPIFVCSL